jgi:heme-degrading monooxygenase HmoA
MSWVLIVHDVDDYPAWKAVFDDAAGLRAVAGEREYRVLCAEHRPEQVVHLSRWTSLDAARRFFESPELVELRARAGVRAPEFLYLEEQERGTLPAP